MKVSVESLYILCKLTNQWSCEIKVKLACRVGNKAEFLTHSLELKGHEHIAKAVTVDINTCFGIRFSLFWGLYNDEDLKSDYLTWKWHQI